MEEKAYFLVREFMLDWASGRSFDTEEVFNTGDFIKDRNKARDYYNSRTSSLNEGKISFFNKFASFEEAKKMDHKNFSSYSIDIVLVQESLNESFGTLENIIEELSMDDNPEEFRWVENFLINKYLEVRS